MLFHSFELPWSYILEEVERLKRLVIICLAVTAIFGLIIPFIPVPKKDLSKEEKLPPRLAQLVMQQKEKPKPPPPKIEKKKEEKKEKKKEEKKKEKKKEPKKEKKKPPEKTQAQKTAEARRKAQKSGLLAFADELADLRDKDVAKLNKTKKLSKSAAEAKTFERNILTSNIPADSGGIDPSKLSRGVSSGTKLQGRETTQMKSSIEEIAMANQGKVSGSSGNKPKRTFEEVTIVFDRNKGSIYSLYNRALRKDPTIAGKIVFELTISPDGSVVDVKVVSSELGNPELERKLLVKIRSFLFEPKNGADNLVVTYPLDFVPS